MKRITSRKKVVELKNEHPEYTLQHIGDLCNISRERVRQILKSEGIETRNSNFGIQNYCKICGTIIGREHTYCSRVCLSRDHSIELICNNCGKKFRILIGEVYQRSILSKHRFCSKNCWYEWHHKSRNIIGQLYNSGKSYAYIARLLHMRINSVKIAVLQLGLRRSMSTRKYDYDKLKSLLGVE